MATASYRENSCAHRNRNAIARSEAARSFLRIVPVTVRVAIALALSDPANAQFTRCLDIDGNGEVDVATDGLLLMRHFFGLRDCELVAAFRYQ